MEVTAFSLWPGDLLVGEHSEEDVKCELKELLETILSKCSELKGHGARKATAMKVAAAIVLSPDESIILLVKDYDLFDMQRSEDDANRPRGGRSRGAAAGADGGGQRHAR